MTRIGALKRSHSTSDAHEIEKEEAMTLQRLGLDKPIHQAEESPFSTSSGFTNFRGLLNLGVILLVLSNARVALENILKYGILVDPLEWLRIFFLDTYLWPSLGLTMLMPFYSGAILLIEKAVAADHISERISFIANIFVLTLSLVVPSTIIMTTHPNPKGAASHTLFSCITLSLHVVLFLKLWSFAHTNFWFRSGLSSFRRSRQRRRTQPGESPLNGRQRDLSEGSKEHTRRDFYPQNLNSANLFYFLLVPTLCYELNYPRNIRIRKRFLVKRLLELVFLPQLILGLIQQWIKPLLQNSIEPFSKAEVFSSVERLMKMAIPNHLIWLIFFYVTFHSAMNVIGELLLFADRTFYKDWWNANSVTSFWSSWNIPVHRFCLRHIYKPLLQRKFSRLSASIVVFLVSAFFHELLVSVPLHMFRVWAFAGMFMQVPFAWFVSTFLKNYPQLGNGAVWASLILGQPLVLLMYFHDYYIQNIAVSAAQ